MTAEERPEGFREPPAINGKVREAKTKTKTTKPATCCTPTLKMFIGVLAMCYFSKSLAGSYTKSTITQVERRFEIPSSTVGIIDGSFEMGNLLVIVVVSYFGAKYHRPKIIATGALLMTVGTLLMALPHFLMGRYDYESAAVRPSMNDPNSTSACSPSSHSIQDQAPTCKEGEEEGSSMWVMVLMGNVIRGFGEATIGPLGVSFIDDFARPENSAFYLGCLHTIAVIGPLFGYTLGSVCASLYVDIGFVDLDSVTITPQDSRWVGAWWLGYMVAGVLSFITSLPFWFLPRSLPEAPPPGEAEDSQDGQDPSSLEPLNPPQEEHVPSLSEVAKEFLPSLKRLFTNKVYMLYMCANLVMFNAFVIIITYTPKYFEQQFGQGTSKTNFLIGVGGMPAVALGIFLSGVIMKKFKLGLLGAARVAFYTSVGGFLCTIPFFALSCQNTHVAGITAPYPGFDVARDGLGDVISPCNSACGCPQQQWDPVCGQDGITYASPCLAGCTSTKGAGKNISFHGCSCVQSSGLSWANSSVTLGTCARDYTCSLMGYTYLGLQAFSFFIYCLGSTPMFIITLRSVDPELKSLAVGLLMLLLRVLGGIPAPIYFGALIDSTCVKWGSRKCGGRGACRLYDIETFRYLFLGLVSSLRLVSYFIFWQCVSQIKRTVDKASHNKDIELQRAQENQELAQGQGSVANQTESLNISDGKATNGSKKMGITDGGAANDSKEMDTAEKMKIDDMHIQ
ncbi:solute carrier organic anion transporter family member 1C1-like [Engraulis encrasicolus]|uniref:solute carrier organic anion transporter family member 1C1-like n=1 Tax=Engraulis encrasicolus TaxID=184585 RepID=UPI002FD4EC5B